MRQLLPILPTILAGCGLLTGDEAESLAVSGTVVVGGVPAVGLEVQLDRRYFVGGNTCARYGQCYGHTLIGTGTTTTEGSYLIVADIEGPICDSKARVRVDGYTGRWVGTRWLDYSLLVSECGPHSEVDFELPSQP